MIIHKTKGKPGCDFKVIEAYPSFPFTGFPSYFIWYPETNILKNFDVPWDYTAYLLLDFAEAVKLISSL